MPRIVVIGGPRTGKTTYATKLAREHGVHLASTGKRTEAPQGLVSTDNYMNRGSWAQVPELVIRDLKGRESFVLEGTQAARVLRRWFREDPSGPKLDKVLVFSRPWVPRNAGQQSMAKGVETVLRELEPMLRDAGVPVERFTPEKMSEEEWREHRADALAKAADQDLAERDASLESVGDGVSDAEL